MRIVFFGSPEFAVPSLAALTETYHVVTVVTQPDRPAGRGGKLQMPAVKALAVQKGIPILQPVKLRDGVLAKQLAELDPDLFVVAAYGRILPPDLLAVPRLGPWNVHASLLPRMRGAAPIQWAVIRGETETGVSIMRMEEGLDTGPVASQVSEPVLSTDTAGTLSARLAPLGARLLVSTLPQILDGSIALLKQDEGAATLAPPLQKVDGQLDFRAAATSVSAHARGVDPWPGATATIEGQPAKLFLPTVIGRSGAPGEFLGLVDQGLAIACGTGAVAFAEVQLPGRKRMHAKALLAGHPIRPGTVFGIS